MDGLTVATMAALHSFRFVPTLGSSSRGLAQLETSGGQTELCGVTQSVAIAAAASDSFRYRNRGRADRRVRKSTSSSASAARGECDRVGLPGLKMTEEATVPAGALLNVTIPNLAGEKLAGIIADTGSKELCVLCHGFRSSKNSTTLGVIASTLVSEGMSTFRFDFSGNGESEGQFAYGNYWKEAEDLRAVIEYWTAKGREVSAIVGHSKGGNVVVLYASKYGDVGVVVNVSGRFDVTKGTKERFGEEGMRKLEEDGFLDVKSKSGEYRVTMESLKDRLATDMDAASRAISKGCRVLTIHGSKDEIVGVENAYDFAQCIPNHELRIFEGANHNYEGRRKELAALVWDFIQGKLSKI